jgi:hypothetical protein
MPNPRAQKPLTLAQVKKDLISFKEPATALADMTAGGLRGLTMGTIGLPGEIESLGRSAVNAMLQSPNPRAIASRGRGAPQISEDTVFPTIADIDKRFTPAIPEDAPNRKSREKSASYGEDFGKLGVLPGSSQAVKLASYGLGRGAGALTRAGAEAINNANLYGEGALSAVTPQVANIVKSGGGNWLRQGLDDQRMLGDAGRGRAMQGWNRQDADYQGRYPERQLGAVADDTVADWANINMRKYMANQMGTDKDPVRLLAEQDISHLGMRPDEFGEFPYIKPSDQTKKLRRQHTERTGEESPVGESSLAAYWENLSDNAIKATTVGDIKNAPNASYSLKAKEDIAPYVDKVPPETPIYNIDNESRGTQSVREQLGFNRLLGVMRDDIAAGRITPEEVSKWDMEQAVRHVDKRDKAIYKAEAEEADRLAKEFAKYFPTLKEYPDKSRWIELTVPEIKELPKGYEVVPYESNYSKGVRILDPNGEQVSAGDDLDEALKHFGTIRLEDALRIEGEKMGHCVGSYCEDVAEGRTRIFSYRDANGDPHVTMEVLPNEDPYGATGSGFVDLPIKTRTEYENIIRQWRRNNPDVEYLTDADINRALRESGVEPRPDQIKQIKGKEDKRPVERYIPYVQDFQRTTKYPIEGDFPNSGFDFPVGQIFDENQVKTLREAGHEVHDYLTKAEREDLVRKLYEKETGNNLETGEPLNPPEPPAEGMKAGGAVHISNNPDTMAMELQNQRYQAGGVVRGLKALKGAMRNPEALVSSARGATKFAEPTPKTMSVIKEKGGNWIGGNLAGDVDSSLKSKTPYINPKARVAYKKAQIEDMENSGSYSPRTIENARAELLEEEKKLAINNWVTNNVGNYVKKEMATPEDPVRLMFEKRAQEIEAQFQVDMNRAQRTRARAEAEEDPRRQVNLIRQAAREEEQAKFDRDFANEHATHLPKDEYGPDEDALSALQSKREKAGFPAEGVAKSEPAKRWENITDEGIEVTPARKIQGQREKYSRFQDAEKAHADLWNQITDDYLDLLKRNINTRGVDLTDSQIEGVARATGITDKAKALGREDELRNLSSDVFNARRESNQGLLEVGEENPWISKLDPDAKVHSAYLGDLGIDHVIDVIRQDVEAGRIRPDQLNKLSMDQAIKRTAEFNMEQAKKMRETAIKNTEGFPVHKEYPEEGYKWIELTVPKKDLPSGWSVKEALNPMSGKQFQVFDESGAPIAGAYGKTEESAISSATKQLGRPELETALKYEGDTMGHCVGGYCPDVMEGKSRIYSLRDQRGEPHVTVEVEPRTRGMKERTDWFAQQPEDIQNKITAEAIELEKTFPDALTSWHKAHKAIVDKYMGEELPSIRQIKGKGNARPIEKYDPYTQDFVRSAEWSDVGDLKNTGLIKHEGKYMTQAEYDDFLLNELRPPPAEGMKAGGKVHVSDNCDCMRMELDNKKFAMGGAVQNPNDVGSPSPQNSASPVASFQAGGVVKGLAAVKQALAGGKKAATGAKAAEAAYAPGVHYADPLQPPTMRMSEALGITGSEGKTLHLTEADRSRVFGPNRGGVGFSALQHYSEPHKEAKTVWGFGDANTTKKKIKQNKDPEKSVWTTFAGSPTQHKSNTVVIKDAIQNLQIANEVGAIHPAQIDLINKRLRETVVKKTGKPLFPSDFDITDPQALEFAKTFDRRAAIGDVLLGTGVKGPMTRLEFKKANPDVKWSDSADMQRLLDRETDPILREAATNDVGPHLFVLDNGKIERPDLNIAFPHQVTGTDLGVRYELAPLEVAVPDWMKQYKGRVDKSGNPSPVGYYDLARNQPQQFISEEYLTNLQKSGNKAGGAVKAKNKYSDGGAVSALMKHAETAGQSARMNNQRM